MRIRTIKPEFFLHDRLFEAEREEGLPLRLAFIGLWCVADRKGRFVWEPRRLGAMILPYDGVDFSRVLDALVTRGFLVRYASESRELCEIPSFTRHQVINNREAESTLPPPPNTDEMGPVTRAPRVPHACPTPLVQVQGEGKGREGKRKGTTTRAQAPRFSPDELDHLLSQQMRTSQAFLHEWHRWLEVRHSKRKRVSEVAAKEQLRAIHAAGIPAGIAAITKSIANDWTGLFFDGHSTRGASPVATPQSHVPTFEEMVASGQIKPLYRGPRENVLGIDGGEVQDG